MKNTFIQSAKIIVLGLVLSAGIAFAQTWTGPTGAPPTNNVAAPINTSTISQVKAGPLATGPLGVFGNTAMFGDVSILGCTTSACSNTSNNNNTNTNNQSGFLNIFALGKTAFAQVGPPFTPPTPTPPSPSSSLYVSGHVTVGNLASAQTGSTVCVNASGQLILCAAPPSPTPTTVQPPSQPHGSVEFPGTASPWQVPADVESITIQAWGAGGGGGQGGASTINNDNITGGGGGGGGGGGSDVKTIAVTPFEFLTVSVGTGGDAGSVNQGFGDDGANGGDGTATTVKRGLTTIALGQPGMHGIGGAGSDRGGADNAGGAPGGGLDLGASGTHGAQASTGDGGAGGAGAMPGGGAGGTHGQRQSGQGAPGNPGTPPGGGGGGGAGAVGRHTGGAGSSGGDGKVIITW